MPHPDKVPEQGESSQTATEAPHPISTTQPSGTFVTILVAFLEKLITN